MIGGAVAFISLNVCWTVVVLFGFGLGYNEGKKRRDQD